MKKVRTIGLNEKDINKAIKDLQNIKKDINKNTNKHIEAILDQAVEFCKMQCPNFTDYTIYWEKTEKGYRIVQEGKGVVFVEFGTGVVGENSQQHPISPTYFGLDPINSRKKNKYIAPDGREAWDYPKKDGTWGITSGQPASMQMYKTAMWLRQYLPKGVSMVIKGAIQTW